MSNTIAQQQKNLFYAKAIFFINALSTVGWTKYQNNFYLENGLSPFDIGYLKSVGLLLKIIGEPIWSIIADLTDPKAVYVLCTIIQITTMEILRQAKPLTFSLILYMKLFRTITSTSSNLVNAASFQLIEGSKEGYGRQRLFGSLAWGLGAYISGICIDKYGMNALFIYTYCFVLINVILITFGYPSRRSNSSGNHHHSSHPFNISQYFKQLSQFLSNPPCRVILLTSIAYGAIMTVPDTFLFISIEKDYHASRTYSGILTFLSILSAMPIFWYSDSIIQQLGHFHMKNIAISTCVIRLILMSLLPLHSQHSLTVLLFLQLIHGINFGLYWIAAADAIYKVSPGDLLTSSMATLNMAYYTCGGTIGNYIFGALYEYAGNVIWVYRFAAMALSIVVILFRQSESILQKGLCLQEENKTADGSLDP